MKILLLSDIHSNITALEAVIQDAESRFHPEETWVMGDLVGYGPDPAECLSLLRSIGAIAVAGNHDLAVVEAISISKFNGFAKAAVEWTRENLDASYIDQLRGLPIRLERHGITLVHGSPRAPEWEYVTNENIATQALNDIDTRGLAVGHTHLQAIYELELGTAIRVGFDRSTEYELTSEKFLVNPGSVGQPRDANPNACYAVLDLARNTIIHRRVEYDAESTARRIRDAGLPRFLADRLLQGT